MSEFELGGRKFKIGKLNTFKQFHIVRRIAPILADLLPALKDIQKVSKKTEISESEKFDEFATVLAPILTGFSKLSDDDSEFVLIGLLTCVEMQIGNSWTKMATEKMLMVQDMDLPQLMQVAGRAFVANLSNFFAQLPGAQAVTR